MIEELITAVLGTIVLVFLNRMAVLSILGPVIKFQAHDGIVVEYAQKDWVYVQARIRVPTSFLGFTYLKTVKIINEPRAADGNFLTMKQIEMMLPFDLSALSHSLLKETS